MIYANIYQFTDGKRDPVASILPVRRTEVPRSGSTASGYGDYLPTQWQLFYKNRWRRVRCVCHSNVGTLYIGRRRAEKLQCVEIVDAD